MDEKILYRLMLPGEEEQINALIVPVFTELIGCRYPPEGVREFLDYVDPGAIRQRFLSDHFTLVATIRELIVGVIEMRDNSHICLLFVQRTLHGRGIGRTLLTLAIERCRRDRPDLAAIDVNSSPNSVDVYTRFGFVPVGPRKTVNGITFVPMVLAIDKNSALSTPVDHP